MDDETRTLKEEEVKVIKENGGNKALWIIIPITVILIGVIIYLVFLKSHSNEGSYLEKSKINDLSKQAQLKSGEDLKDPVLKEEGTKPKTALPKAPAELKESDEYLKEHSNEYLSKPFIKMFFEEQGVISKFAAVINNIARGEKPKSHLEFIPFSAPFEVIKEGHQSRISEQSFSRYDKMVNTFISIDTQRIADLYKQTEELFNLAYQDLGNPQKKFRPVLYKAIDEILTIPIIFDKIYITQGVLCYDYLREDLQNLNNAKKQFFRLGPMNLRKVKKKLKEIKGLLEE